MSYKIIVDSCGELTKEMKESEVFETASLSIDIDGHHIVDDESFDQKEFLKNRGGKSQLSEIVLSVTGSLYGRIPLRGGKGLCSDSVSRTQWIL